MRRAIEIDADAATAPPRPVLPRMPQLMESLEPLRRRLWACALAGALDGRRAAVDGAGCIDRAILDGRVRCHALRWHLDGPRAARAALAYRATLNL